MRKSSSIFLSLSRLSRISHKTFSNHDLFCEQREEDGGGKEFLVNSSFVSIIKTFINPPLKLFFFSLRGEKRCSIQMGSKKGERDGKRGGFFFFFKTE